LADHFLSSVEVEDRLPGRVRREMRHYPFERFGQYPGRPRQPRKVLSAADELRCKRNNLRSTLAKGFCLLDWHLRFVKEHPQHAEWIKARLPPDVWARLSDPSEEVIVVGRASTTKDAKETRAAPLNVPGSPAS
jgi:hypothetical protein